MLITLDVISNRTKLEKKRRSDMVNQLKTNIKKFEEMLMDENSNSNKRFQLKSLYVRF